MVNYDYWWKLYLNTVGHKLVIKCGKVVTATSNVKAQQETVAIWLLKDTEGGLLIEILKRTVICDTSF